MSRPPAQPSAARKGDFRMSIPINRVVVVGAGTMGGGIAALIAGAGFPVTLLDIVPTRLTPAEEARGLSLSSPTVRNRIVSDLWERQVKGRPPALYTADTARLVTLGNLDDHFDVVRDADWIIEVIVEQLAPKQALMARIDAVRKPTAIVSSNTSGIPIRLIAEGRSESFRQHFLGTHFFNPPRYLKLLEVIPTTDTRDDVVALMRDIGARRLGKGVVIARDEPNFIGNRIGIFTGQTRMLYALDHGYTVEEVDALTGPLIGNPRTATFRLADLVGLDVMAHVTNNLYDMVEHDDSREQFCLPDVVTRLVKDGALGNKTGAGFYKKIAVGRGEAEFHVLNLLTGDYEPPRSPQLDLVTRVGRLPGLAQRWQAIMASDENDRAAAYLMNTTLPILAYAARRAPEIAYSLADVDRAMCWGFSAEMGPFAIWDCLGVSVTTDRMRRMGLAVPVWVDQMVASGQATFYTYDATGRATAAYAPAEERALPIEESPFAVHLPARRAASMALPHNDSASLVDLGDGVLCLEFHAKANALDDPMISLAWQALEALEAPRWHGLVIGNQGADFSMGANLGMLASAVQERQFDRLERTVRALQDVLMAVRRASKPVVTAPFHRALGGGAEVVLAGTRSCAAAETHMGLVEAGVGLIPAGGGCMEMLRRLLVPHVAQGFDALPYLQRLFETIALARVSESAAHARDMGFLTSSDIIVMNGDDVLGMARQMVLDIAQQGFVPTRTPANVYALGRRGKAVILMGIKQMVWARFISAHDALVASALAHVLCGGDLSSAQWVSGQYILDLEREAFLSLLGEPKTQERIAHTLRTGKPLRN